MTHEANCQQLWIGFRAENPTWRVCSAAWTLGSRPRLTSAFG